MMMVSIHANTNLNMDFIKINYHIFVSFIEIVVAGK